MDDITDILNWRRMNDNTTSSGQPTERQLRLLKKSGIGTIVNLAPHTNKGALDDEPGSVAALEMKYFHIPVDFDNPTETDFLKFCDVIDRLDGQKIHVHCIYNARVSAFFYRYAKEGRGGSEDTAFALMDSIWRPGGVWARFIGKTDAVELPNRYSGDDY